MSNSYWQNRLDSVIPGGAHTYSKGRDVFPANAPPILIRGRGCYVWDPSGEKYLDFGMGLKSVVLGYSNRKVDGAVRKATKLGSNLSRPSLVELLAAEELVDLVPSAEMVKFAKNGSNVTTAAIKIARAGTGRRMVAVPAEQPFFSFDDWFIGTTKTPSGIPEEHHTLTKQFSYVDLESLKNLFSVYRGEFAAVIMEPAVELMPCLVSHIQCTMECLSSKMERTGIHLENIRKLCTDNGVVLIFDEMRTGFRWHLGGAQMLFGVTPDLSTFGKAIANGYSVSALVGARSLMEQGSTNIRGTKRTFLLSSTHGAEISSLAAFRQTRNEMVKHSVIEKLWEYGAHLMNSMLEILDQSGWNQNIWLTGPPVALNLNFSSSENWSEQQLKTRFYSLMAERNILMSTITQSAAHGEKELKFLLKAFSSTLEELSKNRNSGAYFDQDQHLLSPVFRDTN